MANWETKTVAEVIGKISDGYYVLPVIQRRLVWDEDKMALLFDTLLKGNSFGGIMTLEEEKGNQVLFAYRSFTKDGLDLKSGNTGLALIHEQYFVIDGQQRLQSFYIGLTGTLNGKKLYFNLNSDFNKLNFDFIFSNDDSKLPKKQKNDNDELIENIWYSVSSIYERAKLIRNRRQLTAEIIQSLKIEDTKKTKNIDANVEFFYEAVFNNPTIGISKVIINKTLDEIENRQRIVELFRRLNDGGTKLSTLDLVASKLKGFSWEMESFLEDFVRQYNKIGFCQDELIKLIFILQDNHKKEMANLTADDAKFAIQNKIRIEKTLETVSNFLNLSKLYEYYCEGNRSMIPLYFLAYYIFHKNTVDDANLPNIFDNFDIKDHPNKMYRWIYLSLLNGVFKSNRGIGWISHTTGIRKILEVMKKYKGKEFPEEEIYSVYRKHPLHFFETTIQPEHLTSLDNSVLYYIIYDCTGTFRSQDIDHIHPRNIFIKNDTYYSIHSEIDSIANYQLLDYKTNRGEKSGKELKEWIEKDVTDKNAYLSRHLIPNDPILWDSKNFADFVKERKSLIVNKLQKHLARQ